MMATQFLGSAARGGGNGFDVPVAALAGLSVAFAAFAAPPDLLAQLVGASGLPSVLPAAEPPLGLNARIAIGAAGAILMFAFAFLLLRWLDRFGRRRADRAEEAEADAEMEMPRLRRRDFHPDAAPRPPLCAGAELGEPELELTAEAEVEIVAEPEAETLPAPEAPQRVRRAWLPETAPAPEPEAEAIEAPAIEPAPGASTTPPTRNGSISELLERLEQGLARRRVSPGPATVAVPVQEAPAAAPVQAAVPEPLPPAADDRLQSAIDSLQRLASRQD